MAAEGGIAVDTYFATTTFANAGFWGTLSGIPAPWAASAIAWSESSPVVSSCLAAAFTALAKSWGF